MGKSEALKEINEIFINILDNKDLVITADTAAKDVEDWNSLTHIELVVAIEKHFKIRFNLKEIQSWENVGQMIDCILIKKA
jgi:acyl carrier protein